MGTICVCCGHENAPGLRFCAKCAAELANVCTECGFENPAGFRFCGQCGTNLASARVQRASRDELRRLQSYIPSYLVEKMTRQSQGARGERRTVTVLFADISGFTAMSERLDPEAVYSTMDSLFRSFVEQIYAYEGTVDKFTGDGLMALFGAPVTHEDDPERAIRAAWGMQSALERFNQDFEQRYGMRMACRIGLNSGDVILGELGTDLRLDYTVMGDAVNVAARLEQSAQPGSILVSEPVRRATETIFDFETIGDLKLKGRTAPVFTYRVVGEKRQKGRARGVRGLEAPLVGRDAELAQIDAATRACLRDGRGRIILLTGEAGIGKSRVTAEWRARLPTHSLVVMEAAALSHTTSIGQWVFRNMLRNRLSLGDDDSLELARHKVSSHLDALLGPSAADVLPYIANLISPDLVSAAYADRIVHLTPAELRQQTFLALRDLLIAESARRPLVLIFEDIHWIDRPSLDLLLFVLNIVETCPVLFYCISRADEGAARSEISDLANEQFPDQFVPIHLAPLSDDDTSILLDELLASPTLPASFRENIPKRAEGNPFFLEELIRMLIDRGVIIRDVGGQWHVTQSQVQDTEVPRTLRGLILARIDSLDEMQRSVIQCASVIGRSFPLRLIGRMIPTPAALPNSLRRLQEQGLIDSERQVAGTEEETYAFHHVLTQEAVYGTLLTQRKQELHRSVAVAIEEMYAGRLEEHIEILAHHYYLGDVPQRAFTYLSQAGVRAANRYANNEALQFYQNAADLLQRADAPVELHLNVHIGLGDVQSFRGEYDEAVKWYCLAADVADHSSSHLPVQRLAEIRRKLARAWERKGDYDQAREQLRVGLCLLEGAEDPLALLERARVYNDSGWVAFRQGEMEAAARWTQRALEELEPHRSLQDIAAAYNRLAGISYQQGDWSTAAEYALRGLSLRQDIGHTYGVAMSYNNLAGIYMASGDWEQGIRYAEQSLAMKQRIGDVSGVGIAYNNLGIAYKDHGDLDRAREYLLKSLTTAKKIQNANLLASTLGNLGHLSLLAGAWGDAIGYLEESLQVATGSGSKDQVTEALCWLSDAWLRVDNVEGADQYAEQAMAVVSGLGSHSASALAARTLAAVRRRQGRFAEALDGLSRSLEQFSDLRNRMEIGRTLLLRGYTRADMGQMEEAINDSRQAISMFEQAGATREAETARGQLHEWQSAPDSLPRPTNPGDSRGDSD
jgi:class 3 adenylate cyclase/tetratricopeptide (TPR) repeat protein